MVSTQLADDAYFSLLSEEDDILPISDEKYAEHLQLQEAIVSSIIVFVPKTDNCEVGISPNLVIMEKHNQFSITEIGESSSSSSATKVWKICSSCGEPHLFSVTEIGESSSTTCKSCNIGTEPLHLSEIAESSSMNKICDICVEPKSDEEFFGNLNCSHIFCSDCISKHVASKIEENITVVHCLEYLCPSDLDPQLCKAILPVDVYERWMDLLCESLIPGPQKFYCPFKDCSGLLFDERSTGGSVITDAVCPHCNRLFCAECNVPWHTDFGCQEFQKLNEDERGKDDLMALKLAKEREWKRCPVCRALVERVDGCLFMKCRCHTNFCYRCGSTLTGDHFCPHCQRTW